jgi:hypothetical protein
MSDCIHLNKSHSEYPFHSSDAGDCAMEDDIDLRNDEELNDVADEGDTDEWEDDNDIGYYVVPLSEQQFFELEDVS